MAQWKHKDGTVKERLFYQCGHYSKSRNGQCKKNQILSEWIETEVIEYTRLLVNNPNFAEDLRAQLGQKTDISEIDTEIANYRAQLKKLARSKSGLEHDIDAAG